MIRPQYRDIRYDTIYRAITTIQQTVIIFYLYIYMITPLSNVF